MIPGGGQKFQTAMKYGQQAYGMGQKAYGAYNWMRGKR